MALEDFLLAPKKFESERGSQRLLRSLQWVDEWMDGQNEPPPERSLQPDHPNPRPLLDAWNVICWLVPGNRFFLFYVFHY